MVKLVSPLTRRSDRSAKNSTKYLKIFAFILTLIIFNCNQTAPVLSLEINSDNLSDELLVKFKPGLSGQYEERVLAALGLEIKDEISQIQAFIVSAPQRALQYVKSALLHNPLVYYVEEDSRIPPSIIPNDQYYSSEWHLNKILASEAWDISIGDPNTVIAILDSGVDSKHPDLATKLLQGYNFYDNTYDTQDVYGHGTKVAGAAAALTNNFIGVSSISWQCSILPLRVTDTNGYAYSSLLTKALVYAADEGAKVAVISFRIFGGSALSDAAKYFMDKGGLVVAAGGNDNAYNSDPDNPYIISVSATSSSDTRASFSSYGPYIDLSAPGVGIYTTVKGGTYGSVSGTSFSAPLTAGLVALIFSANPSLTPTEVEQIIESTAIDLGSQGYDQYYGWGRIDASKALSQAVSGTLLPYKDSTPPSVTITYPVDGTTISGGITVSVEASDDNGILKVELYKDGGLYSTDFEAPFSFYWDTTIESNGPYTLMAKAYDTSDNTKESSIVNVDVLNSENDSNPPVVKINYPSDGSKVSKTIEISVSASDESGIAKVEFYIDGKLKTSDYYYPYSYQWNTKNVRNGWHTIMVRAYDVFGNYADGSIMVYVSNRMW